MPSKAGKQALRRENYFCTWVGEDKVKVPHPEGQRIFIYSQAQSLSYFMTVSASVNVSVCVFTSLEDPR